MQCLTKPIIEYPTNWEYRLIGKDEHVIKNIVKKILENIDYTLEVSNKSSNGRLVSVKLLLEVKSEEQRLSLFDELEKCPQILKIL